MISGTMSALSILSAEAKSMLSIKAVFALVFVILASLPCSVGLSAERFVVLNRMRDPVLLFIRSETSRRWDAKIRVLQNERLAIELRSPDRHQMVVRDPQGTEFSSGLIPIREMARRDPGLVIDLESEFSSGKMKKRVRGRRGWRWQEVIITRRTAVIWNFHYSDGSLGQVVSARTDW